MRTRIILSVIAVAGLATFTPAAKAQGVKILNGPELVNDRDNKMNRLIDGDENSFYCYRVRSRGKGTSFFVEKYDKKTLKSVFSKEIDYGEAKVKMEDVLYARNNIYVFSRFYDKEGDKMTFNYQTVSAAGVVQNSKKEIVTVNSDHYEFVDFDISMNPARTKFLIKSCHKPGKDAKYMTDFILVNADGMKIEWTKTVEGRLRSSGEMGFGGSFFGAFATLWRDDVSFLGSKLDDEDNLFYGYLDNAKNSTEKERRYILKMGVFKAAESTPKIVELPFDDSYFIKDIGFYKSKPEEIVVGGFLKDVIERRGRDLVKVGIFSFTIDLASMTVKSHPVKMFDDKILAALESNPKRSRYFKYKLDYIFPVGDDVFFVGEQFREQYVSNNSMGGMAGMGGMGSSSAHWEYEYMDVIVAKLNEKGEFEWISNAPLRNYFEIGWAHIFKQYFAVATDKNIYIFNNDHPKNIERYEKADFEPKDLKNMTTIHGSMFVYSAISTASGAVKHKVIQENETYCFAPIQERNPQFVPPQEAEIFVSGSNNEVYVYTEDRGKDRFSKLTIVE
jgi:hypothetical protein